MQAIFANAVEDAKAAKQAAAQVAEDAAHDRVGVRLPE